MTRRSGLGVLYTRFKELHIMVGSLINIFRFYRFEEACGVLAKSIFFELLRKKPGFSESILCNFGVVEEYRGKKDC